MRIYKVAVAVMCMAGMAFGQGSLTPPGAPGATMKTLDEIDSAIAGVSNAVDAVVTRIDITTVAGNPSVHHTITEPGSYYLSGNLEVIKSYGIMINASGVTLDLNGFKILKGSGGVGGEGVYVGSGEDDFTIRNGSITGFTSGKGINCNMAGALFEKLSVSGCSVAGIYSSGAARLTDCRVIANEIGIQVGEGSVLTGCVADSNEGSYGIIVGKDSVLRGCTARSNGGIGIYMNSGSIVRECTASYNQGDGIKVSSYCLVTENKCDQNGADGDGAGIHATGSGNRIDENNVTDNDRGIDVDYSGNFISRNTASGNSSNWEVAANNACLVVLRTVCTAISGDSGGTAPGSTDPNANFTY